MADEGGVSPVRVAPKPAKEEDKVAAALEIWRKAEAEREQQAMNPKDEVLDRFGNMTKAQIVRVARVGQHTRLNVGHHKGKMFSEIPENYIDYLLSDRAIVYNKQLLDLILWGLCTRAISRGI